MLSHQGVALFERLRRTGRCGLVGGSMSLGLDSEVVKYHTGLASLSLPMDQDVALYIFPSTMPAMLPTTLIMDQASETESKPLIK